MLTTTPIPLNKKKNLLLEFSRELLPILRETTMDRPAEPVGPGGRLLRLSCGTLLVGTELAEVEPNEWILSGCFPFSLALDKSNNSSGTCGVVLV